MRVGGTILALALVVAACSSAAGPERPAGPLEADVTTYFPLTPESRWSYRIHNLIRHTTYETTVRVFGTRQFAFLDREAISVEERYSSDAGPMFVEEQEPMVYFFEDDFLHRVHLTRQAGELTPQSGSHDSRYLPKHLREGVSWKSQSTAFDVGGGLGIQVMNRHDVSIEEDPVHVPAGTFRNCFRVDTVASQGPNSAPNDEEIVFYYSDWYAPGVGLVRTQQWGDEARTQERARIELLDFEVTEAQSDS